MKQIQAMTSTKSIQKNHRLTLLRAAWWIGKDIKIRKAFVFYYKDRRYKYFLSLNIIYLQRQLV